VTGAPPSGGGPAAPGPTGTQPSAGAQTSSIPGMVTLTTPISKRQYVVAQQYANNFKGFVDELENSGYQIKSIGGYANRNIAGTGQKSFHSLGVAIDINPSSNPHLFDGRTVTDMPSNVSALARKYGLGWGGDWNSSKDTMHFSMASKEGGSVAVDRSGVAPLPGAPVTPGTTEMAARAGAPTTEVPPQPGVVPSTTMPQQPQTGTGGVGTLAAPGGQTPISPGQPQATGGGSESALMSAAMAAGITDKVELAQFMAQMAHESGNFRYLQEIWGPTAAQQRYEGRRDLGNTQPGDGFRFRGRGYVQLTGRSNYAVYGSMIGVDLLNDPDLASQPDIAAKLAVAYWNSRVKPRIRDFQDTRAVTKIINGGYNGLDDRMSKFAKYSNQSDLGAGVAVAAAAVSPTLPTGVDTSVPAATTTGPGAAPAAPTTGTGGVGTLAAPGGQTPIGVEAAGKPSNVTLGPNTDVSKVDPDLLKRFYQAAAEYGRPVTINSAYRGDEYQAQLWVRANIFKEPGIFSPAKPEKTVTITYKGQQFTVPGSGKGSSHGRGQALDVNPGPQLDPFLRKYGLNRPFASFDPPHVQKVGGSDYVPDTSPEGTKLAGGGQPPAAGAPTAAAPAATASLPPRPSAPSRPAVIPQPQPQIGAMSQQAAMQDFFGGAGGIQTIIMNNMRNVNNTKTVFQQPSYAQTPRRSPDINPLELAGMAVGLGIGKALRLF
jgi:putative chitinase